MSAPLTLEQARTLVAVARHGSFAKAAKELHKVHSALFYAVRGMEEALGVALLDRSGYRATLTPVGERVVEQCEALLQQANGIESFCAAARAGEEPALGLVYDGLLPVAGILAAVRAVARRAPRTRISLFSEFLGDVESRFERVGADLMISVVPATATFAQRVELAPLPSSLVAAKNHPLAKARRPTLKDLEAHTFLTVRGSDERLNLSTSDLGKAGVFRLSDFPAKRAALLSGMGYGWMPDYLVSADLKAGRLAVVAFGESRGRHVFRPWLGRRGLGKVAQLLERELVAHSGVSSMVRGPLP